MSVSKTKKIVERFNISVDDKDQEVFMSYALLNNVCMIIKDPDSIAMAAIDADMREELLSTLLVERTTTGKKVGTFNTEDHILKSDEVSNILSWALEHALGFFIQNLKKTALLSKKYQKVVEELQSSLIGMPT